MCRERDGFDEIFGFYNLDINFLLDCDVLIGKIEIWYLYLLICYLRIIMYMMFKFGFWIFFVCDWCEGGIIMECFCVMSELRFYFENFVVVDMLFLNFNCNVMGWD